MEEEENLPELPDDIIGSEILVRCSPETIGRVNVASKAWNEFTSSRYFTQLYLDRQPSKIYIGYSPDVDYVGIFNLELLDTKFHVDRVCNIPVCASSVLCVSEGLVLLSTNHDNILLVWNPVIGKTTKVYCPFLVRQQYGLTSENIFLLQKNGYAHYESVEKSWNKVREILVEGCVFPDPGLTVGGTVFWTRERWNEKVISSRDIIFCGSGGDELKVLEKPEPLENSSNAFSLYSLQNCLYLSYLDKDAQDILIWKKSKCGGWSLFLQDTFYSLQVPVLIFFSETGILAKLSGGGIMVYLPMEEEDFIVFDCESVAGLNLQPFARSTRFFASRVQPPRQVKV